MAGWSFVVAALIGVLALEILVFRYLNGDVGATRASRSARDVLTDEAVSTDGPGTDATVPAGSAGSETRSLSGDAERCHHCGVANGSNVPFTFCQGCLRRIR